MEINIAKDALRRLSNRLAFLHEELSYPEEKVIEIEDKLLSSSYNLTLNPRIGQFEVELSHLNKNHRRIIVGNFKIVYRIEEDTIRKIIKIEDQVKSKMVKS